MSANTIECPPAGLSRLAALSVGATSPGKGPTLGQALQVLVPVRVTPKVCLSTNRQGGPMRDLLADRVTPFPRRWALALLLGASSATMAQPVSQPAAVDERLTYEAGIAFEYHSNPYARPGGPSDVLTLMTLGVRVDRPVSLQRVGAHLYLEPRFYSDRSEFDTMAYRAGLSWDWAVGRLLFGEFGVGLVRRQSPFEDLLIDTDNLQRIQTVRALGAVRLTQPWSAFAAVDWSRTHNSALEERAADNEVIGVELGLRWLPGGATAMDFFVRRAEADYDNRQVRDALGAPLPVLVDNSWTQESLLARLSHRPHEALTVSGQGGWTRRRHDLLAERNFSGPTVGVEIAGRPSGATAWRLELLRTLYGDEAVRSSYVDVTTVALTPSWMPGERLSFDGLLSRSWRDFEGDPGYLFSADPVRSDRIDTLGLRANYAILRRVNAYLEARVRERSSNFAQFEYRDRLIGIGLHAQY